MLSHVGTECQLITEITVDKTRAVEIGTSFRRAFED